jgi:hypothetical protein
MSQDLAERVARLERMNRRLLVTGVMVFLILAAALVTVMVTSRPAPVEEREDVYARSLILGPRGEPFGMWDHHSQDEVHLYSGYEDGGLVHIWSRGNGETRLGLLSPSKASVLMGVNARPRSSRLLEAYSLGTRTNVVSGLVLKDEKGITRAELTLGEGGAPNLRLNDSAGKPIWEAP